MNQKTAHDDPPEGWQPLRKQIEDGLQASLVRSRSTFEFVRMLLTTALVAGLAQYVAANAGRSFIDYVAITALWALVLLLACMTAESAVRFSALFGVVLAARLRLPYWRRATHFLLTVIVFSMLLAVLAIGSQEVRKAADRASPDKADQTVQCGY